jgi:hypothetical protein
VALIEKPNLGTWVPHTVRRVITRDSDGATVSSGSRRNFSRSGPVTGLVLKALLNVQQISVCYQCNMELQLNYRTHGRVKKINIKGIAHIERTLPYRLGSQ